MTDTFDRTIPVPIKVAFLGPYASYTHQATLKVFSDTRAFELEPRNSITDVFTAVQTEETDFGVVPFENSSNGSVVQTLDLFSDRARTLEDIQVCGEIYVDIEHYLLGFENGLSPGRAPTPGYATPTLNDPKPIPCRSHPLTDISHIKDVYSHPQAFGQSLTFINTYLRNATLHEVSSTSKGAQIVAESKDPSMASISNKSAAKVFGLTILARAIQDESDNTTKFFILRRRYGDDTDTSHHLPTDLGNSAWKSLIGFGIDHTKLGALANALNVFKLHCLNLTSIHDRPSRRRPWHYIFFVEFEGRIQGQGDRVLEELKEFTEELRWYGSWKSRVS